MFSDDYDTIQAMLTYGGSFVVALAKAAQKADSVNLEIIKIAFAEYWKKYSEMAELQRDYRRVHNITQ